MHGTLDKSFMFSVIALSAGNFRFSLQKNHHYVDSCRLHTQHENSMEGCRPFDTSDCLKNKRTSAKYYVDSRGTQFFLLFICFGFLNVSGRL